MKIRSQLLVLFRCIVAASAIIAIVYFFYALRDVRNSIERTFSERVDLVSTYISMVQQQVDAMKRTIEESYEKDITGETSSIKFYGEYGVWGLSGFSSDKGIDSISGTCTGTGRFPLSEKSRRELSAALSIDPLVNSILSYNKNVTWIYYTSADKFLYLAPKLRISEYQFSVAEYQRPFWSQAVPENNPELKQIISDLYEDSVGKGLMITISSPVIVRGRFTGVVSLDLGIELLKKLALAGEIPGETILTDEKGGIVARMGAFTIDEKYPLGPAAGSWHDGNDGYFWVRREVGAGELNILHRIDKTRYYTLAVRKSLFVWSLAFFMVLLLVLVNREISIRRREADATEKSRDALAESESRLQTLISNLPGFVYRCAYDRDWTMYFISEGCEEITGYTPEELINSKVKAFNDLIDINYQQRIWEMWIDALKEKRAFEFEYPVHKKNGETCWVWERGRGIYTEEGEVQFLEGFITDITKRKQAEEEREKLQEQLGQAHKMESVGRLAGGVAHDFNNMLGVIIGQSELALLKCEPDHPSYNRIIEIEKAAKRSADLTSQLLAFARKQTVAPKVLDLNAAISGMISMLRRLIGEEIRLTWRPADKLWNVRIDPTQLDQVLANLCVNARDAISGAGEITIETSNLTVAENSSVRFTEGNPGDYIMLTVGDNGSGFPGEIFDHIFEPFFTTKEPGKGTGLGLAMVYGIIRQNNGYITVESEAGEGTIFRICLPREDQGVLNDEDSEIDGDVIISNKTVLLVEDEPMLLEMSRTMLEELGYNVLAVSSPEQAVLIAGAHPGGIDLLITDVVMPGMNGRELADKILSLNPAMACIYMSGYTADVIAHHGVLDEGVNFIQKPFKLAVLAEKIKKVLS